jgi:hypothetical protein
MGIPPASDPKADELINSNMPQQPGLSEPETENDQGTLYI